MAKDRIYAHADEVSLPVPEGTKSGDALIVGNGLPAVATTDRRADGKASLQFNGGYNLSVVAKNKAGNKAIAEGDILYMKGGVLGVNNEEGTRYGYALKAIEAGKTEIIAVKVGY
jgi:predicted RecA/RadA family phage recombinase